MPAFLFSVAAIWGVAAVSPGQNFFFIVRCALTCPRQTAMSAVAGVVTGTFCWGLAGWLGVSALFLAAPLAYVTLKIMGSLYLIVLGARLLWNVRHPRTEENPTVTGTLSAVSAWQLGLMTNLANPKSAIFVAGLFSATLPREGSWTHGPLVIATMMAISAAWYGMVASALNRARAVKYYRRCRRWIDAASGVVFVGFGMKLMFSDR